MRHVSLFWTINAELQEQSHIWIWPARKHYQNPWGKFDALIWSPRLLNANTTFLRMFCYISVILLRPNLHSLINFWHTKKWAKISGRGCEGKLDPSTSWHIWVSWLQQNLNMSHKEERDKENSNSQTRSYIAVIYFLILSCIYLREVDQPSVMRYKKKHPEKIYL